MKHELKIKLAWALLAIWLFCLSIQFSTFAQNKAEGANEDSSSQVKDVTSKVIDQICFEITNSYLASKSTKKEKLAIPPKVESIDQLTQHLAKIYSDDKHELRKAIAKLQEYKDSFDPSKDDPKEFLEKGIRSYALDLKQNPLPYNKATIASIISNAEFQEKTKDSKAKGKAGKGTTPSQSDSQPSNSKERTLFLVIAILAITNLFSLGGLVYFWRQSRFLARITTTPPNSTTAGKQSTSVATVNAASALSSHKPERKQTSSQPVVSRANSSNFMRQFRKGEWLVVAASVAGKSHLDSVPPIPCQDDHKYKEVGNGWGIAIVCDGAGSKEYSHFGSAFVAQQATIYFERIIEENKWIVVNQLPTEEDWHELSKRAFSAVRLDLEDYAKRERLDSSSLSCTIIVVIHSPLGILATHIGDGRAAFCDGDAEWHSLITPHKGEEANQTMFLTSVDWNQPDTYIESQVRNTPLMAFALMSDGCESHAFETLVKDDSGQKYHDPNKPYPPFFNKLVSTIRSFHRDRVARDEIDDKWRRFLEGGNEGLRNEPDDKTMILGVLVE